MFSRASFSVSLVACALVVGVWGCSSKADHPAADDDTSSGTTFKASQATTSAIGVTKWRLDESKDVTIRGYNGDGAVKADVRFAISGDADGNTRVGVASNDAQMVLKAYENGLAVIESTFAGRQDAAAVLRQAIADFQAAGIPAGKGSSLTDSSLRPLSPDVPNLVCETSAMAVSECGLSILTSLGVVIDKLPFAAFCLVGDCADVEPYLQGLDDTKNGQARRCVDAVRRNPCPAPPPVGGLGK